MFGIIWKNEHNFYTFHKSSTAREGGMWRENMIAYLRTVPTNGKYFFPDNDFVRQVDYIRGYWNPKRKLGVTTHFSEITALQNGEKRWIGIF